MRTFIFTTMIFLCSPSSADVTVKSDVLRTNLIELYTSEGCSSCPPADRWFSTLKNHPDLWQQLVPMAFHVDYWGYIGWKDRFSKAKYSNRQRQYARENAIPTVYTPGLVTNGKEWRNFSWKAPKSIKKQQIGELTLSIGEETLSIMFEPAQILATEKLVGNVALLGFEIVSNVRRGENVGRKLKHDFVVLEFKSKKMNATQGAYHVTTKRPTSKVDAGRYAIAAWISTDNAQEPLQAVGAWLGD
ncbi:MAG: DUF1223 domain-containing protein [Xanthomonadales bacterium]|nr:DUF1223 domain-containing protein [Xanthomonadales bacterium]